MRVSHYLTERAFIVAIDYHSASGALNSAGIDIEANFFTLTSYQIGVLLELANVQGYRKPKNANGSRARYYFAGLQRDRRRAQ